VLPLPLPPKLVLWVWYASHCREHFKPGDQPCLAVAQEGRRRYRQGNVAVERSAGDCPAHDPESASSRLRCPHCILPRYQGPQRYVYRDRVSPDVHVPSIYAEPPRDRKKEKNIKHSGNVPLEQIIEIARTMKSKSLAKDMAGCVKEILGTAQSVGCTVEGQPPHDIIDGINSGEVEIPDE